jgi:ribosomal protein S18 acetylase RimI-like enzyme
MAAIGLRPAGDADLAFLLQLFASTRADQMRLMGLDAATEALLIGQQFQAQQTHWRARFPDARVDIVTDQDRPAGRLWVDLAADEIRLVDISLLPAYRGRRIGEGLLRELMAQAARRTVPLRLNVALDNPALRLYQRVGFVALATDGVYSAMQWRPPQRPRAAAADL